jgi:hypothetical protein
MSVAVRPAIEVELGDTERGQLEALLRASSCTIAEHRRAQIVLLAAEGHCHRADRGAGPNGRWQPVPVAPAMFEVIDQAVRTFGPWLAPRRTPMISLPSGHSEVSDRDLFARSPREHHVEDRRSPCTRHALYASKTGVYRVAPQPCSLGGFVLPTRRRGVDPIFRTPNGARMLPESGPWENSEGSTRRSSSGTRCA